ncbi:LysR substrate-binding domain-containing protein [Neorhizobium sp. BT27B]|uniref:LysR substrate-binding domain-containing protein n=1 Tax=Neorhizobium sp. BT27B TaxID=3142625 RepID=UPI003D269EB7
MTTTDLLAAARGRQRLRLPTLSRLPPLTALRAFVAAARHESFSRAAEELHVSTAAIGQQVRILETHVGQTLFSRQRGELALTDAGAALYPGLADAFESMIDSLSGLILCSARPSLDLLVDSAFLARVLAPRLGHLRGGLADVDMTISTRDCGKFDPGRFDADVAILPLLEPVPGFICEPLFSDAVVAVCTPQFAERHGLENAPERLRDSSIEILADGGNDPAFDWSHWLRACGFAIRSSRAAFRLSQQTALIETTLAGHGIALVRQSLVIEELASGRLTCPFGSPQPTRSRYHLITSPERRRQPEMAFLLAFLRGTDTPNMAVA